MTEENFSVLKCANCSGWGTIGKIKMICPSCKGQGVIIVDNYTGEIITPVKDFILEDKHEKNV